MCFEANNIKKVMKNRKHQRKSEVKYMASNKYVDINNTVKAI